MRGLLGVAPFVAMLLALASMTATAGEIPYSQSAAIVNHGATTVDPAGAKLGQNPAGGPGVFVDYSVSGVPPWWNQWFRDDPPILSHQQWLDHDLVVEPADTPGQFDLMEAALNGTSLAHLSMPRKPPPVNSGGSAVRHAVLLQPVDRLFTLSPDKPAWIPDLSPRRGSVDFRRLAPGRSKVVPVPRKARNLCVPELAVVVLLVLGAMALAPLRRRRINEN